MKKCVFWGIAGLLFVFGSCTKIENVPPVSDFEKEKGPLQTIQLNLDSNNLSQSLEFDSIAGGGNYSVSFTPMVWGKIQISDQGKRVEIKMPKSNWEKDSTVYSICKNSVCREGKIVLKNKSHKPEVVIPTCLQLPTRTFYLPFAQGIEIDNLLPNGFVGIDSVKTDFYFVENVGDTMFNYFSGGNQPLQDWAWDTIRYSGHNGEGCFRAKIALVIGDTCESGAKPDNLNAPAGSAIWPISVITQNDKGCNGFLSSILLKISKNLDYADYKVLPTENGLLTDTLINGSQHLKYQRTKPNAGSDGFYYYLKNVSSNRVTKAWVRIQF